MIDIKKLKPGMTVFDLKRTRGFGSKERPWIVWPVRIKDVDLEAGTVLASWNDNKPVTYRARDGKFRTWRLDNPYSPAAPKGE